MVISSSYKSTVHLNKIFAIEDYAFEYYSSINKALESFNDRTPLMVILDITVCAPDMIACYEELRQVTARPLVVVASWEQIHLKLPLFEKGVDEFLLVSESKQLINTRLMALLRRYYDYAVKVMNPSLMRLRDIELLMDCNRAYVRGQEVELTLTEFKILKVLMKHHGQVISRERIIEFVWSDKLQSPNFNSINVHIQRIRKKVEVDINRPEIIETVWGLGYKFNV